MVILATKNILVRRSDQNNQSETIVFEYKRKVNCKMLRYKLKLEATDKIDKR